MILMVCSKKDIASMNIRNQIFEQYTFEKQGQGFQGNSVYATTVDHKEIKLVTINEESIYAQDLPTHFDNIELVIFVSRHSSESGMPTLSVHTPGNLREAQMGGLSRRVSISPANAMREALIVMEQLRNQTKLDYDVSYEVTHHGPSLDMPAMFVELGSSIAQWNDVKAAEIVAQAAMEAASKFHRSNAVAVLGLGGLHYNSKFTRIALKSNVAFGHMIPKHAISYVDKELLYYCAKQTLEKIDRVVLDWKGIKGQDKLSLLRILDETGLCFEKV